MNTGELLLEAFAARVDRLLEGDHERVQAKLADMFDSGTRRWPGVTLAADAFAAYLGDHLPPKKDVFEALSALRGEDLYLACATLMAIPQAIETFDRKMLSRVSSFVGHIDGSSAFVDEVRQEMRVKLLLASDGASPAKLATYSGRGALDDWLRAVASRIAVDLVRRRRPSTNEDESALDVLQASGDPELDALRREHHEEFRLALQEALSELEPRQRALLRLYYLENVTFQELGQLYAKHETTTLRWVEQAKATILTNVKSRLRTRLRLSESEASDLSCALQSQLDISLGRLLRSTSV